MWTLPHISMFRDMPDGMHEQSSTTNISQADDNEPFNK